MILLNSEHRSEKHNELEDLVFNVSPELVREIDITSRVMDDLPLEHILELVRDNFNCAAELVPGTSPVARLTQLDGGGYVAMVRLSDDTDPTGRIRRRLPIGRYLHPWIINAAEVAERDGDQMDREVANLSTWLLSCVKYSYVVHLPRDQVFVDVTRRSVTSELMKRFTPRESCCHGGGDGLPTLVFVAPVDLSLFIGQAPFVRRCLPEFIADLCRHPDDNDSPANGKISAMSRAFLVVLDIGYNTGLCRPSDILAGELADVHVSAYTSLDAGHEPVSCAVLQFTV